MAIDLTHFKMIEAANVTGRALSAGYPDLLLHFPQAPVRKDSDKVAALHSVTHPIADSHAVFKAMGLELEVIDRAKYQGCELVVDLNINWERIDSSDFRYFDLVIDPGTCEHCFNIPQALANLADCVKVGGVISQALPMAMHNHGYWNVNPIALIDFYELNGFEMEDMAIRSSAGLYRGDMRRRLMGVPESSVFICNARRKEIKSFQWPQQR